MSSYDLEEQEKLADLKAWWKQYGNLVLVVLALACGTVAAMRGWEAHKRNQAANAGVLFAELTQAASSQDDKKVRELSGTLLEEYPRTVYAPLAAFVSAKTHLEDGDRKTARAQLEWAAERAKDPALKATARLRLGTLLLDEKAYDDALKHLDAEHPAAFDALFAEVRGDIYAAQGKKSEARSAYEAALAATPAKENLNRELLQLKLDALGAA